MPKQLLLVRHAKSDWDDIKLPDSKRPLNSRGEKNAPEMARRMHEKGIVPQLIVSSPALRAITTAAYFADEFGIERSEIKEDREIYDALPFDLMNVINGLDNEYSFIALFGHNPALTNVVASLTNTQQYNIPTCGIALISFPFDDWNMVSNGTGDLVLYDFPKNGED